ncbi:ABC transporter substrate-binding protein [Butyricicoccus faecihominis]|uniref:ABC transporter substrate-binding protein n=1 Tax=Butyricicoccus faecihominis TaxID=1712515 RepID=UPI0024799FB2|nr:ABC transporter substrate-binding protein [Butyricicoccus faecihominis]MCQ5130595.1 ABC transporter substrate-binding protein [Butyricicoccus faecihominis]
MKKTIAAMLAAVMGMSLLLSGCGGGNAGAAGGKDTLTVATSQDPKDLHPYKRVSSQILRINNQIFEPLVKLGEENNTYEPGLATEWEYVDDGMAMQFTLRQDVKFHNGETMTAEDVVYSFKSMSKETASSGGIDWLDWDGVKALDEKTIYMPFTYANSIALGYLSTTNMYIVNQKAMEELGDDFGAKPVGTGAYMIDEWVQGDYIKLKAFDDYWGGAPKIKTLMFRIIPESSQAMIELETGGVNLTLDISGKDIERVEASDSLKMIRGKSVTNDFLCFNTAKEPFSNKTLRQAVAYALDKDAILQAVFQGQGQVAYGPLTTDTWAFDESLKTNPPYSHDLNKAKELMAQAGYPDGGLTIELYIDDKAARVSAAEVIKNQLAQIGITANIHSFDYATWFNILYEGVEDDIYLNGINASTGEPDKCFYQYMHKNFAKPGEPNTMRYGNDEFSKLLDDARTSTDDAFKEECYIKAQQIFMDDVPGIAYYQRNQECAAQSNLQGVRLIGESFDLTGCYFE